jgi:hypothetical protein
MWASGEIDEPKKFSSGVWLLWAPGEIDERRCWTTWAAFKGGSADVCQFGFVYICMYPHMRGPVIYPLSIKH